MKNRFFKIALVQAARLTGRPARILALLVQLGHKVVQVDWSTNGWQHLKSKLSVTIRLIQGTLKGAYKLNSNASLVSLVAACIYFANPFDLVPDMIIGLGLADDMAVLSWVFNSVTQELSAFEAWEKSNATFSSL